MRRAKEVVRVATAVVTAAVSEMGNWRRRLKRQGEVLLIHCRVTVEGRCNRELLHFDNIHVNFGTMKHAHPHIIRVQGWWRHLSRQWDAMRDAMRA